MGCNSFVFAGRVYVSLIPGCTELTMCYVVIFFVLVQLQFLCVCVLYSAALNGQ